MNRLAEMQAFSCVVDTGSFSATALQLPLGQPAILKTIAQLENLPGVHLPMRSTDGLVLDETGQNSSAHAKCSIEIIHVSLFQAQFCASSRLLMAVEPASVSKTRPSSKGLPCSMLRRFMTTIQSTAPGRLPFLFADVAVLTMVGRCAANAA